jgi:hypothetical protein
LFLLLLLVAGLAAGELAGGSFIRLTRLPARFLWLVPLAFALQVIIFWPTFDDGVGSTDVTAGLYLLSLELLLLCVLLNLRLPGVKLLGLGLLLNLTVIAANGGYMPVSLHRLEQVGMEDEAQTLREQDHHLNVTAMADHTRLRFLGDFIPVPEPLPLRSVYSVGDILIAVGGFWLVFRGMTVGVRKALTKRATDRFTSAVEMEGAPRRYSPAEQVDELVRRYRELDPDSSLNRPTRAHLHGHHAPHRRTSTSNGNPR